MLRVAIVGCGKIADQHVLAMQRVPDCKLVGVCDRELLMARQLGGRFGVADCFADLEEMLRVTHPDVVHITTPPQSHFSLGKQCLESGCNVYLEKPFTVSAEEAESLIKLARERNLRLTAGHNYQFTLEMRQMRRLVSQGFLGGPPVHLESHWPYDLSDMSYVGPLLGDRNHWVRQLPGQLFHNVVSHGIAKLAEFLDGDLAEVIATAEQSPKLRSLGGEEVLDELRVMIRDKRGTTAFFCFSTQIKPGRSELRIFGPSNSITVDQASGTLFSHKNRKWKSYLTYFVPPLLLSVDSFKAARSNVGHFLGRRLYQDSGMTELMKQFYGSIREQTEPPISYREILLTARIMDQIFVQVYPRETRGVRA